MLQWVSSVGYLGVLCTISLFLYVLSASNLVVCFLYFCLTLSDSDLLTFSLCPVNETPTDFCFYGTINV